MRPASSTCSVLMKPCPSSPSNASAGTRQFSKITSLVSLARIPSLFSLRPARIPGVPAGTHERRDAAIATRPIRDRHRHHDAGDVAVRDEGLGAVDHPAVAVAPRDRARPRGIAAGRRLGQPPRAEHLPRRERHQELLLLRLGAEHVNVGGGQAVVGRDAERDRRIHAREFLDAEAVVHRGHARPAQRFRELDAHQAEVGQLRQQRHREVLRLVPGHDVRTDLAFGELADAVAQQALIVGQVEIHERLQPTACGLQALGPARTFEP